MKNFRIFNPKKLLILFVFCIALSFTQTAFGQTKSNAPQATEIAFENLADFVADSENHPAGERLIISAVPLAKIAGAWRADLDGNHRLKGLFAMDFENGGADGSGAFLTSAALVRRAQANGSNRTASLRVTARLVETGGEVSRAAFVIKVEGLNRNGKVIWTASGDKPAKVKF